VDSSKEKTESYRFGDFVLDTTSGELRSETGTVIHLQPQPARLLALLVSRSGEVVTREEIRSHLWKDETFVDFEHAVNFCIRQIRAALDDDAKSPRFVETLPRRGYRFIAQLRPSETDPKQRRFPVAAVVAGVCFVLFAASALVSLWPTVDMASKVPEAHEAYLKGRYLWRKGTSAELEQALVRFDEALRLDPGFAAAYGATADTYQLLANNGARPASDAFPKARSAAERALNLSPQLAEARTVMGTVLFRYEWDWQGAESFLRTAVELDPQSAAARHDYAWFLMSMKRFDQGVAEMRKAHELDPLSLRANVDIGWAFLRAGRVDEAITHLRRILDVEPEFAGAQHCLEAAFTYKGMHEEALEYARRALARSRVKLEEVDGANKPDPKSALESIWRWRLRNLMRGEDPLPTYRIASMHSLLGNGDEAFVWLNRAFEERDPALVTVNVDEAFKLLRPDPRFGELLRRIGLPN
jgi:DNA-binding winged helix-turn-helix (wHTH) protein/Tfp pilus assembly protein PilF